MDDLLCGPTAGAEVGKQGGDKQLGLLEGGMVRMDGSTEGEGLTPMHWTLPIVNINQRSSLEDNDPTV